jgi:ParB-like nuclease family protein
MNDNLPLFADLPRVFEEGEKTTRQIIAERTFVHKDSDDPLVSQCRELFLRLNDLPLERRVEVLNALRQELHNVSPFNNEPVDLIQWVPYETVRANDYNPNAVAPPEMALLEHSIKADGYTQPIVTWSVDELREVIDGFHRNRVGRESVEVRSRVLGYLPVVTINQDRADRNDRIAATIRHNRARGKHKVEAMSDIVIELKRRNWTDDKIGRELGMDSDEVLRLCQITGLAEMFANQDFSQAWDIERVAGTGGEILSDVSDNAPSGERIFHTWEKWECYRHGFYEERPPNNLSQAQGEEQYRAFLADLNRFEESLTTITREWKFSCEHYLTNDRMNRVAWLGQASVAEALRIPSCCRGGYHMLTQEQKYAADQLALKYLNEWLVKNGRDQLMLADAVGRTEAELY